MEQEMQSPLQGRKSACDELTTVPIPCSLLQGGGREPKIKQIPGKKECGGGRCSEDLVLFLINLF